jgi:hypothetical protein
VIQVSDNFGYLTAFFVFFSIQLLSTTFPIHYSLSCFLSFFLSFLVCLLLPNHCRCRGLLLYPITLSYTHTYTHTHTLSSTPLDEQSAHRRDLYLTTHTIHKRQTSMSVARFEPTVPAVERRMTAPSLLTLRPNI